MFFKNFTWKWCTLCCQQKEIWAIRRRRAASLLCTYPLDPLRGFDRRPRGFEVFLPRAFLYLLPFRDTCLFPCKYESLPPTHLSQVASRSTWLLSQSAVSWYFHFENRPNGFIWNCIKFKWWRFVASLFTLLTRCWLLLTMAPCCGCSTLTLEACLNVVKIMVEKMAMNRKTRKLDEMN